MILSKVYMPLQNMIQLKVSNIESFYKIKALSRNIKALVDLKASLISQRELKMLKYIKANFLKFQIFYLVPKYITQGYHTWKT